MRPADVQCFDRDGTWVKPPGAVCVEVTLKGGDGGRAGAAGPGSGAAATTHLQFPGTVPASFRQSVRAFTPIPGEEGNVVRGSFTAAEMPDRVAVTVGQPGGYAHFITRVAESGTPLRAPRLRKGDGSD